MNAPDAEVIIVGGGMTGLSLALALAQAEIDVLVLSAEKLEAQLASDFDGRASAIAYASFRMWRALGLEPALAAHSQPIERILVTDGKASRGPSALSLLFDRAEIGPTARDEPLGYMIENRAIRAGLVSAARARGVKLVEGREAEGFAADAAGAHVRLRGGGSLRARLAISAEGRNAVLRDAAGIRTLGWDCKQTAIVCTLGHARSHEGVAHEYFLPPGPFAMLPLTDNRTNIVWTERPAVAKALLAVAEADFLAELSLRFGGHLGDLRLLGRRFAYPLSLQLAERWIGERLALVGDCAHGVHPIAGQGLNIGLRDVAALAECVADSIRLGLDPADREGLARYQRWRRFDALSLALTMDGFNRIFSNDLPILRPLRALGMALVDAAPAARALFLKEAAGGAGDLPKLLRGEALAI
jgi:2-octaprenyl-6-methoxyphenol hydroxylase